MSRDGTAYDLSGPEHAPVVVLIHGLGLSRGSTWSRIAPALAGRYRVLSYDLCGHGESLVPDGPITLTRLGRQLTDLLDELQIGQAALIGFSLGGMINRRCAIDAPERVSALVILNSPHDRGPEAQQLVEQRARDSALSGPSAGIDVTLARWFTQRFRETCPEEVERIRSVVLANDPTNYAAHRQVLAVGVRELIAPQPPITTPTLVMTCANDSGSTPAMAESIASGIDRAECSIVPDLQHLGLVERPDLFLAPIRHFLSHHLT